MGDFFCADKKHPGQPKKNSWPARPPLKVPQKLHFFTLLTFSSISRLSRHIMQSQLSNPSILSVTRKKIVDFENKMCPGK